MISLQYRRKGQTGGRSETATVTECPQSSGSIDLLRSNCPQLVAECMQAICRHLWKSGASTGQKPWTQAGLPGIHFRERRLPGSDPPKRPNSIVRGGFVIRFGLSHQSLSSRSNDGGLVRKCLGRSCTVLRRPLQRRYSLLIIKPMGSRAPRLTSNFDVTPSAVGKPALMLSIIRRRS
jgi:hypothetical protein